jgi:hypothetical protein
MGRNGDGNQKGGILEKVVKRWLFNFLKNWILTSPDENNCSWAT